MKRILSLGGNYVQMSAIKRAKEMGIYVIDADYSPGNPGHIFADEYHNISTLNREGILELAFRKSVDGIMSYASDVSAPTAAYVAEQLNLPTNSSSTVEIMTRKDLFKRFLNDNGFNTPKSKTINKVDELKLFFDEISRPIIIKPLDSSGSKGVYRIIHETEIEDRYNATRMHTNDESVYAEEFIERKGYQLDFDIFVKNGEIISFVVGDQHCDPSCNPYVPVGISFPSVLDAKKQGILYSEAQRAVSLLGFMNGAVNLEAIFDNEDRLYILEMGPRAGGNLIPDAIHESTGVDIISMTINACLGQWNQRDLEIKKERCVSSYVFHSSKNGVFEELWLDDSIKQRIIRMDLFVRPGDSIRFYDNSECGLGMALLSFDSIQEMIHIIDHMNEYYDFRIVGEMGI